jgi:hypothetical protein
MLRFIKHHLTSIDGIEIFPIISLIIFVTFFIGLAWFVIGMKKDHIDKMSNIPLEDEEK